MTSCNELRDGQEFYGNGYKQGYKQAILDGKTNFSRPQGEWIAREDMDYLDENKVVHNHFQCDKCWFIHDFIDGHTSQYNFCPSCGSDMKRCERTEAMENDQNLKDTCDFSGYVTKYDILCYDGNLIAKNAFDKCNNKIVPLTYNFYDDDINFVLGHVTLECRSDGVYGYCKFNDHISARIYRRLMKDHIFKNLGICATDVINKDKIVTYGVIREVAIVNHSTNPGAYIDYYADMKDDKEEENGK